MNITLPTCLLLLAIGHAAIGQDASPSPSPKMQHLLAQLRAAVQAGKMSEGDALKALKEAQKQGLADADLPIVQDANFSIDISANKNESYGGEPVQVSITLKNNGIGKVRLSTQEVERFFDIEVVGPYGATDGLPSREMRRSTLVSARSFDFLPGQKLSGWVIVSNLFDMSLGGTYKITVSKRFRLKNAKGDAVTIASNTLKIKVASDSPVSQWMDAGGM